MKKNAGFSSFEFYFVVSVIGLVLLFGIHRYYKLAEETQRLSFEILAQNFSAAVYSHRARWIIAQQSSDSSSQLRSENMLVQFSSQGWPLAVNLKILVNQQISLAGCASLWNAFLENPPAVSFLGGDTYGSRKYHLSLVDSNKCRYEWIDVNHQGFYFEYSPFSGQIMIHSRPTAKNT